MATCEHPYTPSLRVNDERHVQGLDGFLLGLFPTSVITGRGGDIGVTHKSLNDADANLSVEGVGHAGTSQVGRRIEGDSGSGRHIPWWE